MNLKLQADPPPLHRTEDQIICISGTRIPLERVIRAFLAGSTPEQIAQDYDVLSIEDVYAVVNYYLHHRTDVDSYLSDVEQEIARIRKEIEHRLDATGIRARLLARRAAKVE